MKSQGLTQKLLKFYAFERPKTRLGIIPLMSSCCLVTTAEPRYKNAISSATNNIF